MKLLSRIALLGLCGILGVTLAVYVAAWLSPGVSPVRRLASQLAADPQRRAAHPAAPTIVNPLRALPGSSPTYSGSERRAVTAKAELAAPELLPVQSALPQPLQREPESSRSSLSIPATAEPQLPITALVQLIGALERRREPPEPALTVPPQSSVAEPLPPAQPSEESAENIPALRAQSQGIISSGEGDHRLRIHIQDEDLRTVLQLLSEQGGRNILASKTVEGKVSASLNDVDVDTALRAILKSTGYVSRADGDFIYVGTPQDFVEMERNQDRVATRIYRPNYVTAQELQALIPGLLTEGIGKISVTSVPESGIAKDENKTGGESFASGAALLVQDYESVLLEIDQIVAELDVRPMQVAIEAMILSVALDDTFKFGVDFGLLRDKEHVALASGSPLGTLSDMAFNGGLKFAFLDSSLGTFLTALETVGDTNVIATPRLMCLNKQRAEILIGEQLGYVNTTVTETSATQSVEFLEVGAQLRLRPFIYSDGTIRMEVHPELSTGSVSVEGGFTLPKKDVTQVTTNIMVRDGCTVVIGGLMREDLERSSTQVPLLGSMPGVGWLFRSRDYQTRKREILVLVTPRIVYDPQTCAEGDQLNCEIERRHDSVENSMSPVAQRYLAKKCCRRAKEALESGDVERAWRLINLSVRYDPLSREALALQSQIGAQFDPHCPPGKLCPADSPLEGEQIAPWLLEELQHEGGPVHPRDPGQPGRKVDIDRQRSS